MAIVHEAHLNRRPSSARLREGLVGRALLPTRTCARAGAGSGFMADFQVRCLQGRAVWGAGAGAGVSWVVSRFSGVQVLVLGGGFLA